MNRTIGVFALVLAVLAVTLNPGQWAVLVSITLMIVAHELGHYLTAVRLDYPVERFSIGFGTPRLVLGRSWGTEFQITPWLFGGYVSIDPTHPTFLALPMRKRAMILAGGPAMNFALALVMLFGVALGKGASLGAALAWALKVLLSMTGMFFVALASLFTEVHSVFGIIHAGGEMLGLGLGAFFVIMASISVSLGALNLLPVPLLDGGHLLYLGLERLIGKPVSLPLQASIGRIFFALLIGLMAVGIYNDIFNPIKLS